MNEQKQLFETCRGLPDSGGLSGNGCRCQPFNRAAKCARDMTDPIHEADEGQEGGTMGDRFLMGERDLAEEPKTWQETTFDRAHITLGYRKVQRIKISRFSTSTRSPLFHSGAKQRGMHRKNV